MKLKQFILFWILFLPCMLFSQLLDYELGVVDLGILPAFEKSVEATMVANNKIHLITYYNGDYDLLQYDGDTLLVLASDLEDINFRAELDNGIVLTIGSISSTVYLYFLDHATSTLTQVHEFANNFKSINVVNNKALFLDWNDGLFVTDGTLAGTQLVKQFIDVHYNEEIQNGTDNFIFFQADDQIWKSDGTIAGTEATTGIISTTTNYDLKVGGNNAYFIIGNPNSNELWRTDGTAPAEMINDIGIDFTDIEDLTPTDSGIIFMGTTADHGKEVWVCDINSTEAQILIDLIPGPESGVDDHILYSFEITTEDQVLLFRGDGANSGQVWKTDGTLAGTTVIIDFTGQAGYDEFEIDDEYFIRSQDGKDYFITESNSDETKLWVYDNTIQEATFLADIGSNYFRDFASSGAKFYFNIYDSGEQLWVTEGTPATTVFLGTLPSSFSILGSHNDLLYYTLNQGLLYTEPYVSDGTVAGTGLLKDIHQTSGSEPEHLFIYNNQCYFYVVDHVIGQSIYTTNGTESGTVPAFDLYPNTGGSDPEYLTSAAGKLYFTINDTLWASDGTQAGSVKLNQRFDNNSYYWGVLNDHLFFVYNYNLYCTDGTPGGTYFLLTGASTSDPEIASNFERNTPAKMGNHLWFFYDNGNNGYELFQSDGTPTGTLAAFESIPGEETIFELSTNHPEVLGDRLFFSNQDATYGRELWISDGTLAGTALFQDLNPGTSSINPTNITRFKNKLYFSAFIPSGNLYSSWVTDGTEVGTVQLADVRFSQGENGLAHIGSDLFYISDKDLWKTNGTPEGTMLVQENQYAPEELTSFGDKIIYSLRTATNGIEPWISDGTPAGTQLLKDLDPADDSQPSDFSAIQNLVFFATDTTTFANRLLWVTEGTMSTTKRAPFGNQELNDTKDFSRLQNRLFFRAKGDVFGREIYYLDFSIPEEKVSGHIYHDANANGQRDLGENGVFNFNVIAASGQEFLSFTDTSGYYQIYLPEGDYEISPVLSQCWAISSDSLSYQVTSGDALITGLDFGLTSSLDTQSVAINIASAVTRCSFTTPFWLNVGNRGCDTISTLVELQLDSLVTFVDADLPPDSINGQLLKWNLETLEISEQVQIRMNLIMPDEQAVEDTISIIAKSFIMDADTLALSNEYEYTSIISCAIDPNDKTVSPNRENLSSENYTLFDEKMTYTIRFQNTGTDTAFTVRIIDSLSAFLDISTFQPLAASHPFQTSVFPGGVVEFLFEDILLPDSTVNEIASHGFVNFEIYPITGLDEFSEIENTAYIYFDFNSAVVTNTITSTMVSTFDFDNDGFDLWNDCDDSNPDINAGISEIPYNGLDDDCNSSTLDDDLDQDGFVLDEDCDDNNPDINPAAMEIPYNGVDDDCESLTLDDDLDQDGFALEDDCDDTNPDINPDATDIPDNGIDEDCDGEDMTVSTDDLSKLPIRVFPNPTNGLLKIILPITLTANLELQNCDGKILLQKEINQETSLDMTAFQNGVFLLLIKTERNVWVEKVVKME